MARRRRSRRSSIEDWGALQAQFQWSEQRSCELIRPVVLFGQPPAERAISRTAALFDDAGMRALLPAAPARLCDQNGPQAATIALLPRVFKSERIHSAHAGGERA